MTNKQQGSTTAKGNQPTVEQFRARFEEFRSQFTLEFFDQSFLNIIQYAAISGRTTNKQIVEGLFVYRFIRATFIKYVYATDFHRFEAEELNEVFSEIVEACDVSFEASVGPLLTFAAATRELGAEGNAEMIKLFMGINQVLALVTLAHRIALAV